MQLRFQSVGDIDVEPIARETGAEVHFKELDSCEARIIPFGDRAVITVEARPFLRADGFGRS